ncbi:DUF4397 domain-containing protein [Litorilinea aerophila]|uniref:DUF4397 domain-containing protein n=1 Tax=Litorilinea aerophila TaxID=1204385 RepID=A0A540VKX6_9CHLR|nr:DUF4397 domain-containing protein [Litorilinea aerophila]MCC9075113.1 DUF4397 domain-containing protein [Litorilinea aerophila]
MTLSPASKCSGGNFALFESPANYLLVGLEDMTPVAPTNGGACGLQGQLRIKLPGNDIRVNVRGDVDAWDQFISTSVDPIVLNVAGLTFRSTAARVYPDKVELGNATLTAPQELGGGTVPVQIPPKIDRNGLRLSDELVSAGVRNAFNLPAFKVPSGLSLLGLYGDLVSEANGYKFTVEGKLWLPYMKLEGAPSNQITGKDLSGSVAISAKFSIFVNAAGATVIQIMPADNGERVPIPVSHILGNETPQAPDGCFFGPACLSEVGLSLYYKPGINLDQGYAGGTIWLTGVRGSITVTTHDTAINIGVTIETSTLSLPVLGSAIRVDGDARMQFAPELGLGLRAALKFFILEAANAEVSYSASQGFRAYIGGIGGIAGVPIRFEGEVRVWGSGQTYYAYSSGPVYVTGSGRAGWYIKQGEIYQSCSWLPCGVRMCTGWIWFFGWRQVSYPCGVNYCYSCLNIPPNELWLGGGQADIGRFKGDLWGIKGAVHFLAYSTGVFLDLTNGRVTLGNVNGYVLDAPSVQQAMAVQAAGTGDAVVSAAGVQVTASQVDANTLLLKTPVGVVNRSPAELSVLRDAAIAQGGVQAAAALDAITTTQVITQTDTIFSISMTEPLTPSLFTPNGTEITLDNYSAAPEGLTIQYSERYTYTEAASGTDTRVRFASALLTPVTVTLKVDGVSMGANLVYASPYVAIVPGMHTVTIEPTDPPGLPSVSASVNAITGTDSTVLLHYNNANQLTATVFSDSRVPPSSHGKGLVRFINVLGNRNDPLSLYVNGQLIGQAAPGQASAYVELPAGAYNTEVRDDNNTVVLTGTLTLVQGDHRALVANSQVVQDESHNDVAIAGLNELAEVVNSAVTFKEFFIDQAPVGEWKVQLLGDTSIPTWRVAVLSAANPPVISNFVAQPRAGDPHTVDASLRLKSDYAPTKLTFFVARPPITVTATMTNADNTLTTEIIPTFQGEEIGSVEITDLDELSGATPVEVELDLSFLESGEYYLWVQVEDGVSPSVNQYATSPVLATAAGSREVRIAAAAFDPQVQYADAAPIPIDHRDTFPEHFATAVITPELQVEIYMWQTQPDVCDPPESDPDCQQLDDGEWGKWVLADFYPLYFEWTPSHHPDTDGYVIEIVPISSPTITATQLITVGDSIYEMYDDNNNFIGVVGFSGWREVAPDSTYRLRVGAIDYDTDRIAWSPSQEITVPLGWVELFHLDNDGDGDGDDTVQVPLGGEALHTILLSMTPEVFYEVMVEVDLWNLPPEVDVAFVDAEAQSLDSGYVSPRGRLAPASLPAGPRGTVVSAARVAPDGSPTVQAASRLNNFNEPLTLHITAAADAPPGLYTIPIRAINGPSVVELPLRIIVGQTNIYLPVITR